MMARNRQQSNGESAEMRRAIELRAARREKWRREGERALWRNLSMIGALGWLIVTPALIGVLAGRWLDGHFGTGIFYTGACIFMGVALGCYLAWRRVNKE